MQQTTQASTGLLWPEPAAVDGWGIVAVGDLDGDGTPDLIWQHSAGYVAAWFMNGTTRRATLLLHPAPVAVGGWR